MTKFGPKLIFCSIWARPCRLIQCPVGGSVGGCGARAVSRKTPIYFIFLEVIFVFFSSNSELCFQQAAVASLEAEGLSPKFHLCDLGDLATVEALRDTIKER